MGTGASKCTLEIALYRYVRFGSLADVYRADRPCSLHLPRADMLRVRINVCKVL